MPEEDTESMKQMYDNTVVVTLNRLLNPVPKPGETKKLREKLIGMGEDAVPGLIKCLLENKALFNRNPDDVKAEAAKLLGQICLKKVEHNLREDALAALSKAAKNSSSTVQKAANDALNALQPRVAQK
jgi:hypothetical protein